MMVDFAIISICISLVVVIPHFVIELERKNDKRIHRLHFFGLIIVSMIGLGIVQELFFVDETLTSYLLFGVFAAPFMILSSIAIVRRLKDLQHNLLLYWLVLIPVINIVFPVYLLIAKSKSEDIRPFSH